MFLCLFDYIFGFLLVGPVFVLCYCHFYVSVQYFGLTAEMILNTGISLHLGGFEVL